jgi:hypothetical protein
MINDILNQVIIAIIITMIVVYMYYMYATNYKLNTDRLGDLALMKFHMSEYNEFSKYTSDDPLHPRNLTTRGVIINDDNTINVVFKGTNNDNQPVNISRIYNLSNGNCRLDDNSCVDIIMNIN